MQRIGVFCGANVGRDPRFREAAADLGRRIARRGAGLVYGGGRVGLMGVLADAALAEGGEVIGVIPEALSTVELAHPGLTAMHVVAGMHPRKAKMAELSDAFLAMPGGYGTLEEFFEVVTWTQLGFQRKPVGIYNVGGYFDPLLAMLDRAAAEGFIADGFRKIVPSADDPETLLDSLARLELPPAPRWTR